MKLAVLTLAVASMLIVGLRPLPSIHLSAQPTSNDEMYETMERMKDALKATAMSLQGDGGTAEALAHVAELQRLLLEAKLMTPAVAEPLDEDEKQTLTREYRRQIIVAIQATLEMELHLLDDNKDAVFAIILGELFEIREAAHDEFQPED